MNYVVYNNSTGQITSWGTCREEDFASHAGPGETVIEGHVTAREHYIDVATQVPVGFPAQPTENHRWNWETHEWIIDTTLAVSRMREERDLRLAQSDWIVVKAVDTGSPVPSEWSSYRQALRDIPSNYPDGLGIEWPETP